MASKVQLEELVNKIYEVRSFADQIKFRIEVEIDDLIEIVEDEIGETVE